MRALQSMWSQLQWNKALAGLALTLLVVAGIALAPNARAQAADKPDFSWSPGVGEYVTHEKVVFANGAEIRQFRADNKPLFGCDMSGIAIKSKSSDSLYGSGICDGIAHIQAAWPSTNNAKVAIVSTNCGGTMCASYSNYLVVLIDGTMVRVAQVGTIHAGPRGKSTTFNFSFAGNVLRSSVIANLYSGDVNSLGDLVSSRRTFVTDKGYVADAFKPQYLELVGEHPERFFENESMRAALVGKTGPVNFRGLRNSFSGPGSSRLIDGRFVLMEACQKSNCDSVWGAVAIDGFTGDAFALVMRNGSTRVEQYGTRPLNNSIDASWYEGLDTNGQGYLMMDRGVFSLRK